jgi:hypothetical protein
MEQERTVVAAGVPAASATPGLMQEDSFLNQDFLTKNTTFDGKPVSFCLQSHDGPCPLLAMANVLLLRQKLRIKPGSDRLTTKHVLTVIGDAITSHLGASQSDDLELCLDELRQLQFGLQVNCGFRSCVAFERTTGFRVFDLLGVKVLHGWLPEDPESVSVLESMTYNEAAELVAMADDVETRSEAMHDNNLSSDKVELLHKAAIVRRFLDASPSQLTFEGLIKIHAALSEGELAVLFRNNHFSTIILHEGVLYALVTDVGFQHRDDVIWETLNSLHGDTHLVNCHFREAARTGGGAGLAGDSFGDFAQPGINLMDGVEDDAAIARRVQAESDAAFARSLQQQMDSRHGSAVPVGELRVVGVENGTGKEILEDEVGNRFVRRGEPRKSKKKAASSGSSSEEGEDKKGMCTIS